MKLCGVLHTSCCVCMQACVQGKRDLGQLGVRVPTNQFLISKATHPNMETKFTPF